MRRTELCRDARNRAVLCDFDAAFRNTPHFAVKVARGNVSNVKVVGWHDGRLWLLRAARSILRVFLDRGVNVTIEEARGPAGTVDVLRERAAPWHLPMSRILKVGDIP